MSTLIYVSGAVVGWQQPNSTGGGETLAWEHRDTHNASYRLTHLNGAVNTDLRAELDVTNSNVGLTTPPSQNPTIGILTATRRLTVRHGDAVSSLRRGDVTAIAGIGYALTVDRYLKSGQYFQAVSD